MNTSNVDTAELSKFSDLAHRWWDSESEFKPLHEINPLRLEWINSKTPVKGLRVLDVGCGGGILTESLAALGADVTGIDLAEKSLGVARLHGLESGIKVEYQHIAAETLAEQQPASFDIVTCLEMLEHVPSPASTIDACARLVKPGGHVYFSTINRNPKAYLLAIVGAEYILKMLPKGTHSFDRFIKPSELTRWARACDLEADDMIGLHYNPLTELYSLGTDTSVNYLVHTIRQN
jgi:2-polyprenyl-6-hydroxyphenyl methylase / 3-demethylubiquinone-9 3-methyltransferase